MAFWRQEEIVSESMCQYLPLECVYISLVSLFSDNKPFHVSLTFEVIASMGDDFILFYVIDISTRKYF